MIKGIGLKSLTCTRETGSVYEWLTDKVITAGQMLLKAAHPGIGGLQDTILGETLAFDIAQTEFVLVHWITVSSLGCKKGHIDIFDSLPSVGIQPGLSSRLLQFDLQINRA